MKSVPDTNELKFSETLANLSKRLNSDVKKAERVLADTLHVLRDNLPYDKAILIYNSLPQNMKCFYIKGWNRSEVEKRAQDFCNLKDQVLKYETDRLITDLKNENEVMLSFIVVFELLRDLISEYNLNKILQSLPNDMKGSLHDAIFSKEPKKR